MGAQYNIHRHIHSLQLLFSCFFLTSGQAGWPRTFMLGTGIIKKCRKYLRQDGQSFTCRQRINACSAAPCDLFSWNKSYCYTMICNTCILFNWTQEFYMCARNVLTLLAADSAMSRIEPAGDISAHVSSILAGFLLLFPPMLGGPGPAPACPPPLTTLPSETVPGSSGSGQFLGSLSGTERCNSI
jgi:hypothetical protein